MKADNQTPARTEALRQLFRHLFGADPPAMARAPGQVNLIGDHTDYNEGFVSPLSDRIKDRLKYLTDCESGAGTFIVDTLPEETATELRGR